MNKQEVGVIILGGGYGTRIKKELGKKPKPLAIVSKKPFLYWIIQFLMKQGLSNIIIATHYAHEQINNYIDQMNVNGLNISSVYENFPLGTGGAVINAIVKTKEKYKYYLILNGDSLLTDKFCKLFNISADDLQDWKWKGGRYPWEYQGQIDPVKKQVMEYILEARTFFNALQSFNKFYSLPKSRPSLDLDITPLI